MSTLEKDTVDCIAHMILAGCLDTNGQELVALVGTGCEGNNLAATGAWVVERAAHGETVDVTAVFQLCETFECHLHELKQRVYEEAPVLDTTACLPRQPLSDTETRRIADSLSYLLASPQTRETLEVSARLLVSAPTAEAHPLASWVRAQNLGYVFYPAELTLPLAQRLQRQLSEMQGEWL